MENRSEEKRSTVAWTRRRRPANLALSAFLLIAGCDSTPPTTPASSAVTASKNAPRAANKDTPNLLLITLDTTRADRLGCYGGAVATPNIDRLAGEGAVFERCYAAAPLTLPSHSSIFTGTYPFVHGVRNNGNFRLSAANQTLAETLHEAGYSTGACVGALVLDAVYGLNQGFEHYRDTAVVTTECPGEPRVNELRAAEVTESAVKMLRTSLNPPFFLFAHYFDAHDPYDPPPPFNQDAGHLYEGEIAYVDAQLSPLFDVLREIGQDDNTLIVLTADHGEALGEHGEDTHGYFLYDSTLRVPLIICWPKRIAAGTRVTDSVSGVDIAPTALALLRAAPLSRAQGADLSSLFASKDTPQMSRLIYSETFATLFALSFAPLRAVRQEGWKLIHAPRDELYEYSRDPAEKTDQSAAAAQRVKTLDAALRELIESAPTLPESTSSAPDASAQSQIQALGYVGASGGTHIDELESLDSRAPNPMDHARVIHLMTEAVPLVLTGDYPALERKLRELLEAAGPVGDKIGWAQLQLASALLAQNRFAEAIAPAQRAVEADPGNGEALTMLGMAQAALNQHEAAIKSFRRAIATVPEPGNAHRNLGLVLMNSGEFADAAVHLARAIEIDATIGHDPSAYAHLAQAQLRAGDRDAARKSFLKAAQLAATAGDESAARRFEAQATKP